MPLNTAYLALGSNIGQRMEHMRSALQLLGEKGVATVVASPVYESRAVGLGKKAGPFLNAVVQVQTELDPEELLEICLAVEAQLGRVRSEVRTSRTIDIDLLTYGKLKVKTEKLQLPHPRITEREFVLQPFADIAPDFKLHGKSVETWLNNLPFFELTGLAEKLM